MDRIPKPGEFYRHFKDKLYQVTAVAEHTETGEMLVVYQALYGTFRIYARPLSMFTGEVDREKYPDAVQRYRFEKVELPETDGEGAAGKTRQETGGNPLVLAFLEAGDFGVKLELLSSMEEKIRQEELNMLCESLDLPESSGDLKEQVRSIKQYLQMRRKFDGGRLR